MSVSLSANGPDIAAAAEAIAADFAQFEDWEDRFAYLMELGAELPPLPAGGQSDRNKVRGCASQVWLISTRVEAPAPVMRFQADSDALLVKGLAALLLILFDGRRPAEILDYDAGAFFARLGLASALTPQRSNGLAAMLARLRADSAAAIDQAMPERPANA